MEENCMHRNALISVMGNQNASDKDDGSRMELVTQGKYYKKGEAYYVTYKESEVTGMEGTTTTLKIKEGVVTLTRFGAVNSQMIFEQGRKHISYYDTKHGAFTVGIVANSVDVSVNDCGGEIKVDYLLEIDHNGSGCSEFRLKIRTLQS
jgi:uncharacterized beta-barrel protein YwiB (DUF1934 family)